MSDKIRGRDAEDAAPQSSADPSKPDKRPAPKQDGPNYEGRVDGGRAEPVEKLNSANDE